MSLKYKISKLEDVAEAFRSLYTQGEDGAYYLAVDGAVSREKLDEFRNTNVALMKQLEDFKGVDPAKYRELIDQHRRISEKKLIEEGKVEELITQRVQAMKTDFERQLSDKDKALQVSTRQLETLLIDNSVRDAASKVGVASTAIEDVLLRAKTVFQIQNGKPVAMKDGQIIYGTDGVNSIGISDWVTGLKEQAPHLFMASTGSGTSTGRSSGSAQPPKSAQAKISAGLQRGSSILS